MLSCDIDCQDQAGPSQGLLDVQQTPVKRRRLDNIFKSDIHSQTKSVVVHIYEFVKKLADPDFCSTINFKDSQAVTSLMTGISLRSIQRCLSEDRKTPPSEKQFLSPRKSYKRAKKLTELSDFDCDVVRRTVLEFYDKGEFPTSERLRHILKEKIGYEGSITSVQRLLRKVGFHYKKGNDGRKFLFERKDIVAARIKFLRKMRLLKRETMQRDRIYLDETWVNQNHSRKYIWQHSDKTGGLKVPTGKGGRLIVCHAGGAKGFLPNCKWIFKSKKVDADYHTEMNGASFKDWFKGHLLPSLEEPTVIIMDNAPYHSNQVEKVPTGSWRKADIQQWLNNKHIDYSQDELKSELLEKVYLLNIEKRYEIDELAMEWGHEVVRLPPYHCQYNPIELVWAQVKGEVAKKNNTFKMKDIETLTSQAIDNVTVCDWEKCVGHAEKLQESDWEKEIVRDDAIEPIVINLREDSESNESDSE